MNLIERRKALLALAENPPSTFSSINVLVIESLLAFGVEIELLKEGVYQRPPSPQRRGEVPSLADRALWRALDGLLNQLEGLPFSLDRHIPGWRTAAHVRDRLRPVMSEERGT